MNVVVEVFLTFLRLGLTSFGGPAVHIGIYRRYLVEEKKWLSEQRFADLLAFANFLPGPTSSQVAFSIGLERAGLAGGVASQLGFALPSMLIMLACYALGTAYLQLPLVSNIIAALKLFAVAVVFDAVWSMAASFCRHAWQRGIALVLFTWILLGLAIQYQLLMLALSAVAAWLIVQRPAIGRIPRQLVRKAPFMVFGLLLLLAFIFPSLFGDFYKVGALVFGGGHVVLPLMQDLAASELDNDIFLAGYGIAQAVPGPMFTLATFVGANLDHVHPVRAALTATLAVFLPGYLLIMAFFSSWKQLAQNEGIQALLAGVNAGVVGILAAALINPIIVQGVHDARDIVIAIAAMIGLTVFKLRVFIVLLSVVVAHLVCGYLF